MKKNSIVSNGECQLQFNLGRTTLKALKAMVVSALTVFALSASVWAACTIPSGISGEVNVLMNSFPSLEAVGKEMETCQSGNLKITTKLTKDVKEETIQSFGATSSRFDVAQVSAGTYGGLKADGVLQPITDLVKKYKNKYNIEDSMLIKADGEVYAIAFQVNTMHLFYRKDLFDQYKIKVPTTYSEVIAAAKKLQKDKSIDFPLGGIYKQGWNLGNEFVNMHLGNGGVFFKKGSADVSLNNSAGRATLKMMKNLMKYMSPDSLTQDTQALTQSFQQGRIGMANMWASRAASMDDSEQSKVVGKIGFSAAPKFSRSGAPATALWWDGFVLAKNMDGDREAAFLTVMEGLKESVVAANGELANWTRSNYKPSQYGVGVLATMKNKAAGFPSQPYFGLLHTALGNNIADYLNGKESASETLKDVEAEYRKAAKEKGYL